jgi:exosortase
LPSATQITMFGQTSDNWRANPWLFLLGWISSLIVFAKPVNALVRLSFQDERYSHLVLIPFISIGLIYLDRRRIFREQRRASSLGILMLAFAGFVYWVAQPWSRSDARNDQLWLPAFTLVLVWIAVFVSMNGPRSAVAAMFPLCFLVMMTPVPAHLLDHAVYALQRGSAEVTHLLFKILRIPVLRHDFRFSLPGIDIEIAEECSGIRSSTALLIAGMLAAHLFLRSTWKKLGFVLFTIPVAIFKNAVRIVTLSSLSVYVDSGFLNSPLHRRGGVLFALVGLAILLPVLLWLRRWEAGSHGAQNGVSRTLD